MTTRLLPFVALLPMFASVAACSSAPDSSSESAEDLSATKVRSKVLAPSTVSASADVPGTVPAAGAYRLQMIDVGTGLSVLVQGHDFTLLYDAGSNDDAKAVGTGPGNQNRLLAYLYAAVGPSGGPECVPDGDAWTYSPKQGKKTIDHLVLSHAHEDHISMMADVLHCYTVSNIWEPGAKYASAEYAGFTAAVKAVPSIKYHTAAKLTARAGWSQFAENDVEELGEGAFFKVLHANGVANPSDINENSTVLRLTLGKRVVLLMGDAEAGARAEPVSQAGDIEGALLATHASELAVDILQVGHHGSETSSRSEFVDAVFPGTGTRYALMSAGPRPYSGVVLPDADVVSEYSGLEKRGVKLLRTDTHDGSGATGGCPTKNRVGVDDDSPAGCDNLVIDL